ncbi:MAG: leucine-rich repeat domain-containing protein [Calditrichae bacterium]|nr:leucine-rich repeat domain-containing protein [Calditrichia bacterium]
MYWKKKLKYKLIPLEDPEWPARGYEINSEKRVVKLFLVNVGLQNIPLEILDLEHLEYLDISGNKLKYIPNDLTKLKEVRYLNLSDNSIHHLPVSLKNFSKIEYLGLSGNNFSKLPNQLFELKI